MPFFDLPSLLFILCPAFAAALSAGFRQDTWPRVSAVLLPVGQLGMTIGLIHMLAKMDNPEHFWPAFFVATLTVIYAATMKLGVQSMASHKAGLLPSAPTGQLGYGALVVFGVVILAAISIHGEIFNFIDISAIVWVSSATALAYFLPGQVQRVGFLPALTRILPWTGVLAMIIASVAMFICRHEPQQIGPWVAFGLLSYLYTNLIWVGAILLKPTRAQRNGEAFQWVHMITGVGVMSGMFGSIIYFF